MAINTNSNTYTIIYASVVVVIVAFLLAFVSKVLEPQSKANERIDKKKQILSSLNIRGLKNGEVEARYEKVIQADQIINSEAKVIADGKQHDKDGFALSMKEIGPNRLPIYVCRIAPGNEGLKYVFPLVGKGLWGAIWGYIALNSDLLTVYGVYFSHQSETAGLGARITEAEFQQQFVGKHISKPGSDKIDLAVVKNGKVQDPSVQCDGITGATLTSDGVSLMLQEGLANYRNFLHQKQKPTL